MASRLYTGLPLSNIHIILHRPQRSANVGSVARVLQNFGLSSLRIVSERKVPHVTTVAAAKLATPHGAPLLNSARMFTSLSEVEMHLNSLQAVSDLNVVVGTTRRGRFFQPQAFEVTDYREKILSLPHETQVGFLFGPENKFVGKSI